MKTIMKRIQFLTPLNLIKTILKLLFFVCGHQTQRPLAIKERQKPIKINERSHTEENRELNEKPLCHKTINFTFWLFYDDYFIGFLNVQKNTGKILYMILIKEPKKNEKREYHCGQ